jgi:hypothetical protein
MTLEDMVVRSLMMFSILHRSEDSSASLPKNLERNQSSLCHFCAEFLPFQRNAACSILRCILPSFAAARSDEDGFILPYFKVACMSGVDCQSGIGRPIHWLPKGWHCSTAPA